jgi:hypothetical protein
LKDSLETGKTHINKIRFLLFMKNPLDSVGLTDLLMGIIALKPDKKGFTEEALEYGLKQNIPHYKRIGKLFKERSDSGQEKTDSFNSTLRFAEMGLIIAGEVGGPYYRVISLGGEYIKQGLVAEHGKGVIMPLQQLANQVWKDAASYRM